MIVKGRNRDTAWFAMLDSEWPERKKEFERWLAAGNFDEGQATAAGVVSGRESDEFFLELFGGGGGNRCRREHAGVQEPLIYL